MKSSIYKLCTLMLALATTCWLHAQGSNSLILVGLAEGPSNGIKTTEFYALKDIPDLSVFGVGSANNGGGSDSIEYTFPAVAIAAGTSIFLARDSAEFHDFWGFNADFIEDPDDPANTFNGDDAYELFENGEVVDVFGEIDVDGSGQPWEYTDGWAKRRNGTGPDGSMFIVDNWIYSGLDVYDGVLTNAESANPYPLDPYSIDPDPTYSLVLTGIAEGPTNGAKLTEFYVLKDIPDLSKYGVGSANNGGGSDSVEYMFPAISVDAGTIFYLARDSAEFHDFYGFQADFLEDTLDPTANTFNGDDAYEVFENGVVIDVFGDINVDGTGEPWEYTDGWAYRRASTGPDGSTFVLDNWRFSPLDVFDGAATNMDASEPYPAGAFIADPCFGASDIVITEIMYNSPGADFEFLELYNASDAAIDLTGYTLSGVDFTFPNYMIPAGEYVVVSADSLRTEAYYGMPSFQWTSGSLSNGGETITVFDADGNTIDCVEYGPSAPWPVSADGDGPSLVLCDPLAENTDGANWDRATSGTGILLDGKEIFCNPGSDASCQMEPLLAFALSKATLGEANDSIAVVVYLDNPAASETTVDVQLVAGSSATSGADFTFTDLTLTFPAASADPRIIQFGLLDDADAESSETFTLQLTNPSNNAVLLNPELTVRIIDNDQPPSGDLVLVGVNTGPSTPLKTSEYYAINDIPDLSVYGVGSANNGGGSDGIEYRFPAIAVAAGTCFYLTRDTIRFHQFFGFPAAFEDNGSKVANTFNGDDAFELFQNEQVVDVFGDINADGSGTPWEYAFGWAHRKDGTGPDGSTFVIENWEFSGVDAYTGDEILNDDGINPYPALQCYVSTGIELVDLSENILVYPNPAASVITIQATLEIQKITLMNALGQELMRLTTPGNQATLDLSGLGSDLYLLNFVIDNKTWTQKIIVQH